METTIKRTDIGHIEWCDGILIKIQTAGERVWVILEKLGPVGAIAAVDFSKQDAMQISEILKTAVHQLTGPTCASST